MNRFPFDRQRPAIGFPAVIVGLLLLAAGAETALSEAPDFPARSVLPPRGFILRSYDTASYQSFARALDVVDAALQAHGALGAVPALSVSATGTQWIMGNHSRPWENKVVPAEKHWVFQGEGRAASRETMFNPIAGRLTAKTIVAGAKGLTKSFFEPATQELTGSALEAAFLPLEEALPHLLLRQAKRFRMTLRYQGDWADSTGTYDVVTFATGPARLITLFVNRTSHLLARVEKLSYAGEYGDVVGVTVFGDYHEVEGVQVPGTRRDLRLGKTDFDLKLSVEPATQADLEVFAALGLVDQSRPAADPLQGLEIKEIAPRFHAVLLAARGVKSFVVERSDHLAVIETPFDRGAATAILAAAANIAPQKPVRYVAFSHEHRHTSTGAPAFLRDGTTLIGTEETIAFVEDLAALEHRAAPDGSPTALHPRFASLPVKDRLDLPDEQNPIVVYNAGVTSQTDPSSTAEESFTRRDYLLFYLPKSGVLLNGCLSSFREGEEAVGSDRQEALLATIRSLKLTPKFLCSAMGTDDRLAAPFDDLERAVEKRHRLKPLTDELEGCDSARLTSEVELLAARCRSEELGVDWFDGQIDLMLLKNPGRARAWALLLTRTWPKSPRGWARLSEAEEALGDLAAALDAAQKASGLDPQDKDLLERLHELEKRKTPR